MPYLVFIGDRSHREWLATPNPTGSAAIRAMIRHRPHTHTTQTMNVTASSTKAEIIDASMEIIATQDEQIADLKQRQTILLILCAVLGALLILS